MKDKSTSLHTNLLDSIKSIIQQAQQHIVRNVNTTMLITYFEIGKMIIEHEQHGKQRADYAKQIIMQLSKDLTKEFGRGYSVDNLERFRNFIWFTRIEFPHHWFGNLPKLKNQKQELQNPHHRCGYL